MGLLAKGGWDRLAEDVASLADLGDVVLTLARLAVAALLGGLLGYERERLGKAAGLRTHMLVAAGSAFFVIPAQLAGDVDLGRVIQGVAAGVGFIGGGPLGALLLTLGIFLPAFAFTLLAHDPLERLLHHPRVHAFLEGVTAAVVGLIAGTAGTILVGTLSSAMTITVFVLALAALFYWNTRLLVPMVIAGAAIIGALAYVL